MDTHLCNHKTKAGKTALVIYKRKYTNEYPRRYACICRYCGEQFKLTEEEYKKLTGEVMMHNETDSR